MESALKYDQNSLIASLKWAKNAFFGIPDLKNDFPDQNVGGRFFHPDDPIFGHIARQALLPILDPKNSLKRPKNRYFCSPVALLRLQNVFFMLPDHKNGG